jgi:hypothetical protein
MFGFVFVIPPVWHEPHEALNRRLPRFTCSGVKTTPLPAASNATVRVASSNSIANALKLNENDSKKTKKIF